MQGDANGVQRLGNIAVIRSDYPAQISGADVRTPCPARVKQQVAIGPTAPSALGG